MLTIRQAYILTEQIPVNRYYKETVITQKGMKFLLKEFSGTYLGGNDEAENLEADRAV